MTDHEHGTLVGCRMHVEQGTSYCSSCSAAWFMNASIKAPNLPPRPSEAAEMAREREKRDS